MAEWIPVPTNRAEVAQWLKSLGIKPLQVTADHVKLSDAHIELLVNSQPPSDLCLGSFEFELAQVASKQRHIKV